MTRHTDECQHDAPPACPFTTDDVVEIHTLLKQARKSALVPNWSIGVLILVLSGLFGMAIYNRTAITTLANTQETTARDVKTIARALDKHMGPGAVLPGQEDGK